MQDTITDLPDLAQDYPVTPEQIARYQRDGHILLRRVASAAEVAAYRPHISGAALRYSTETRPLHERNTYGKAFHQVINLWERDESDDEHLFCGWSAPAGASPPTPGGRLCLVPGMQARRRGRRPAHPARLHTIR